MYFPYMCAGSWIGIGEPRSARLGRYGGQWRPRAGAVTRVAECGEWWDRCG